MDYIVDEIFDTCVMNHSIFDLSQDNEAGDLATSYYQLVYDFLEELSELEESYKQFMEHKTRMIHGVGNKEKKMIKKVTSKVTKVSKKCQIEKYEYKIKRSGWSSKRYCRCW